MTQKLGKKAIFQDSHILISINYKDNEWQYMNRAQLPESCLKMEKSSLRFEKVNLQLGMKWFEKMKVNCTKNSSNTAQYVLRVTRLIKDK